MQRTPIAILISAGALALALAGPASAAQSGAASNSSGSMAQSGQAAGAQPYGGGMAQNTPVFSNLYRAKDLDGLPVRDAQGQNIGKITEVLIGQNGQISNVIVKTSHIQGAKGDYFAVPWNRIQINAQQHVAEINTSRNQLTSEFAAFKSVPPTMLQTGKQRKNSSSSGAE